MTKALTTCAASSAEDAVKEMEMRYERVSFVTTTLLRNIATVRSNGEWLRVSGRNACPKPIEALRRPRARRAGLGILPESLCDRPQDRIGADQTSLTGDKGRAVDACQGYDFLLLTGEQIRIDESLRRILARHQRYDDAREHERERDERYDEPSVPHNRRWCAGDQIFIVGSIIRALELKIGPFLMIEL